jgi:hypothetical protein
VAPSEEPTTVPSETTSEPPNSTPEPTDGPVIFPDGARLSIQPCDSDDYLDGAVGRPEEDACPGGDTFQDGEVWAFIVFNRPDGSDPLTVQLLQNDTVQNEQELTIDSVLGGCDPPCIGLIFGPHYVDLFDGDYKLILLRNGEFADSATFRVER